MKKLKIVFIFCLFLLGCGSNVAVAEKLSVMVGIPPYAGIVEKIGGGHLDVHVLLEANQDPHTFEPGAKKVMSLGKSKIYFSAGLEFEKKLLKKINSNINGFEVVDLSEGVQGENQHDGHHVHGEPDHESHLHGETDPHLWLSPTILAFQASRMARKLIRIDPEHAEEYKYNVGELVSELTAVQKKIATQLIPYAGRSFFVFHPAFSHFGKEFGLKQRAAESAGRTPTPKQLAAIVAQAKREHVKIIFVQPQFDHASAEVLAASIDGVVVPLDPLAKDVIGNFNDIAEKLERAFQ